jgi:ribosomal protein L31
MTKENQVFVCFDCQTEFTQKTALQIHQIYLDANRFPRGLGIFLRLCCPKCYKIYFHPKTIKEITYHCTACATEFSAHKLWWQKLNLIDDQGQEIVLEYAAVCPACQHPKLRLVAPAEEKPKENRYKQKAETSNKK